MGSACSSRAVESELPLLFPWPGTSKQNGRAVLAHRSVCWSHLPSEVEILKCSAPRAVLGHEECQGRGINQPPGSVAVAVTLPWGQCAGEELLAPAAPPFSGGFKFVVVVGGFF